MGTPSCRLGRSQKEWVHQARSFRPLDPAQKAALLVHVESPVRTEARSRPSLRTLRGRLLAISPEETSFAVRGFRGATDAQCQLEEHGEAFIKGFNLALIVGNGDELAERVLCVRIAERGFAYEGAGMAFALLDLLELGRGRRLGAFLNGSGAPHVYMVHVGAGWALARLRRRPWGRLRNLDPLLRWLAIDGYGFHEGFFHPRRFIEQVALPRWAAGRERQVFDQGLGRSLWFVKGADVDRIGVAIKRFPPERRPDIWSGVGLAAAYAGAVNRTGLERLRQLAAAHLPHVAQGAAFAVKARLRASNPISQTDTACEVLCGTDPAGAAAVVDEALHGLDADVAGESYALWRGRIRAALAPKVSVP